MATGNTSDYTSYTPTSQRVGALQKRLEEVESAAVERDDAVDQQIADLYAQIDQLKGFCLAFGVLVLVMSSLLVLMAVGILKVGG